MTKLRYITPLISFILICACAAPVATSLPQLPTPMPVSSATSRPVLRSLPAATRIVNPFRATVTAEFLNVRSCGALTCDVASVLTLGSTVSGFCNKDGWCNIGAGWIWRGCTSDPAGFGCEAK